MKTILVAVCIILFSWTLQVHAEMRKWTSVKGDTIEAELIRKSGNTVILKTSQGKQLKIPVSGLSKADHEYLLGAVPPKLKITVKDKVDRDKEGDGYYYERTEETHKFNVTIEKTSRDKCNRKFKARLYVIAHSEKKRDEKQLIGYATHDFSFDKRDEAYFSDTTTISSEEDYWDKEGYQYEGYLVCVEDDAGKILAVETNQGTYEKNLHNLKKADEGALLSRSLSVTGRATTRRRR